MTTLVIGSSGFLGRVVTEKLQRETSVTPTHFQNPVVPGSLPFDLLRDSLAPILRDHGIESVVFCAGFEQDTEASSVERAMKALLTACNDKRFVYLSSDAIFAGDRGHYREDERPEPRTPYGHNLHLCETLVRERCPDHLILRPSYIYGFSQGQLDSRLDRTLSATQKGESVSLFEDMYKSPLGVEQVAEAVAKLSRSTATGTLHVAGPRLSVLEFHREALSALGQDVSNLVGVPMPTASGLQRDTSLDTTVWKRLSGTRILSVSETLSKAPLKRKPR